MKCDYFQYKVIDDDIVEEVRNMLAGNKINVNKNWFYHAINLYDLDSIMKNGLLSLNKQNKLGIGNKKYSFGFNGNNFISVSRKYDTKDDRIESAYQQYNENSISLIINDNIKAIHTTSKGTNQSFYYDEYHVKDQIPVNSFLGFNIRLSRDLNSLSLIKYELTSIKILLDSLSNYNRSLLLIDNNEYIINQEFVHQYVKRNRF